MTRLTTNAHLAHVYGCDDVSTTWPHRCCWRWRWLKTMQFIGIFRKGQKCCLLPFLVYIRPQSPQERHLSYVVVGLKSSRHKLFQECCFTQTVPPSENLLYDLGQLSRCFH
ncbi:hypothetical protein BJV74DRAFT_310317 [Russula compacta]|nr:hypothetical protein BJV74DRAFT_310317 [Russula compacta]